MDKELIERLAREAKRTVTIERHGVEELLTALDLALANRFAAMVAEECAKVADEQSERENDGNNVDGHPGPCDTIADAIREKFKLP